MGRVIFILVDALGFETAVKRTGLFEHMAHEKRAAKYLVKGELPSCSRPIYETLMTGLPVCRHGVFTNRDVRPSRSESIFSLLKRDGRVSAAAAYMWMFELYCGDGTPFCLTRDRFALDGRGSVDHGIFYSSDSCPDEQLYADAEFLRKSYSPDFLLVHTMSADDAGHRFGGLSAQYAQAAALNAELAASMLETWRNDGYDVVYTGDHGMDGLGLHGGDEEIQRMVPLYVFSDKLECGDFSKDAISQLNVAPMVCRLLELEPSREMISPDEIRWRTE